MITIRPFKGWRPAAGSENEVASPPYDVLSSLEARVLCGENQVSFLKVIKPEVDLDPDIDLYSESVYQQGKKNWESFKRDGVFVQDEQPCYYLYRQSIGGHSQTGIVAASSIDDYFADNIKKHEYTRPKKENDRIKHMYTQGIHAGPVFLTYKHRPLLREKMMAHCTNNEPVCDFEAEDGVRHTLWVVRDADLINRITDTFQTSVDATYIADGHHRAAASSKVGMKLREEGKTDKQANHNYFLSVLFPDDELSIIDYNRLIKDLNGLDTMSFLEAIGENFEVSIAEETPFKPAGLREFGMYINETWYKLVAKKNTFDDSDPINCLDVTVLSNYLIEPVLGIADQRTDERIDFVGGIRGLGELEKRVDSGEMAVAFALYPVSIKQLIDIADAGMVMPPKSTWFEPKLRSGLVVHEFNA